MANHILRVIQEPFGWTVCLEGGVTSPYRTRVQAVLGAERMCRELRRHGESAEIILLAQSTDTAAPKANGVSSASSPKRPLHRRPSRGEDTR